MIVNICGIPHDVVECDDNFDIDCHMGMIEHLNIIDTLSDQISALLDLMMMADDAVDIKSIHTASEMCLTMHDELMAEVDKISKEIKEQ